MAENQPVDVFNKRRFRLQSRLSIAINASSRVNGQRQPEQDKNPPQMILTLRCIEGPALVEGCTDRAANRLPYLAHIARRWRPELPGIFAAEL